MKKTFLLALILCFLFAACSAAPSSSGSSATLVSSAETHRTPDSTSEDVSTEAEIASETTSAETESPTASPQDDEKQLRTFLDGLVSALNNAQGDNLYYYSIEDDGVFFTISIPAFDPVYESLDSLSADDLASARKIALDFVSGDFAKDLVNQIHSHGGASKSVYITLGCTHGICMASRNLHVFMDELKR